MMKVHLLGMRGTFNRVYDSDGESGPFCDMEDPEATQDFYEYALPDVLTPDSGNKYMVMKLINLLREEGKFKSLT